MKYIKFTYVDSVTGISVASAPAENGPVFPDVAGLEFAWARESAYPTHVPEFFGTCPDDSLTQVDGVLDVMSQAAWDGARDDELAARSGTQEIRHITVGAFFDRFGAAKWAILADTTPTVQAVIKDASVRKYIDLGNPDLPGGIALLVAAGHEVDAEAVINAPVQPEERP